MRLRALVPAGCLLMAALLAAASFGAPPRKPARSCHVRHRHRVCRVAHNKPRRTSTTTATTATTTTTSSAAPPDSSTPTTSTTSTQTGAQASATQTTTTSSSTAAQLPHGTEVDERATGLQSPFYALTANEPTLAAGTIHFNVYNFDQDPHTIAVADASGQQLTNPVAVPAGHPGTAVTVTVNLPPGTYVLYCTLPQHAADGMKTTIVVK